MRFSLRFACLGERAAYLTSFMFAVVRYSALVSGCVVCCALRIWMRFSRLRAKASRDSSREVQARESAFCALAFTHDHVLSNTLPQCKRYMYVQTPQCTR